MKKYLFLIISALLFCGYIILFNWDDPYFKNKDRQCVLLNKMTVGTNSDKFILALKEERGIIFDLQVNPATYMTNKIGDTLVFNLTEHDIKTNSSKIMIFQTLPLFLAFLTFISVFVGFAWFFVIKEKEDSEKKQLISKAEYNEIIAIIKKECPGEIQNVKRFYTLEVLQAMTDKLVLAKNLKISKEKIKNFKKCSLRLTSDGVLGLYKN